MPINIIKYNLKSNNEIAFSLIRDSEKLTYLNIIEKNIYINFFLFEVLCKTFRGIVDLQFKTKLRSIGTSIQKLQCF